MPSTADVQRLADLTLDPNEASGMLRAEDQDLLDRYGWDHAFWSVLDEVDVHEAVVLIGHEAGKALEDGWSIHKGMTAPQETAGRMRDAESLSRWDGWIYVFGSHHGGKDGPIRRTHQWVARFEEGATSEAEDGSPQLRLQVADTAFRIHRLVNDALRSSGIDVLPMGPLTRAAFIDRTRAELAGTLEAELVRDDDWTINIEGITFTPSGSLLLGLRFPVTADGCPIVVEVDSCAGLFDEQPTWPQWRKVVAVEAVGRNGTMAGVRDMCVVGDALHLVTGDLDSAGKGSVIRQDYPSSDQTVSTHFTVPLAALDGGLRATAKAVAEFPDNPRIEGIAEAPDGRFFYVSDEDESVTVRSTPLLASSE